ncbi:protein O-mannosyl-transferase TMTC2-like [Ostrinia nubilalis]|uniref:protein O-mannosyl-transferase TMTC2-like n=1 Tax=Ostrinia nubilalis TaxID=29057 RepID=UPI0030823167
MVGHWVTAASSLLAFLLYYNSLDAGFVYDDRRAILSNPDVIGHTPIEALFENDFWGTPLSDPGSHGSYRPLCVATYRLNYAFSGFKPWSYHFLNVILHCTATALVVTVARRILPHYCMRVGTVVTGFTFAAHPIHTEAVSGIVGRADLAACNLVLLCFLLYNEHIRLREEQQKRLCRHVTKNVMLQRKIAPSDQTFRLSCHGLVQHIMMNFRRLLKASRAGPMKVLDACEVKAGTVKVKCQSDSVSEETGELIKWLTLSGTLLFAAAGTLCKEPAIMVLPLCIFYDFIKGTRQEEPYSKSRWRSICALGTGGFALLYWRLRVAGTPTPFAAADNPASRDPSYLTRLYTFSYLPVFNFFLLLYPFQLSFDWSMESIPRITSISDPRNISTVLFYAVVSKVTWRAMINEFKKSQEKPLKDQKYYKKQNCKVRHKWNYNTKQYNRGPDCVERKSYHAPHKENMSSKKILCPCTGCKHTLTEEHTSACRAVNNNNTMMHSSTCVCPMASTKSKAPNPPRTVYRSPQVALLMSVAFMVLPFVPATNVLFYVGFVVAERVLYIPSVGFCLLLGLGAGALTRSWHRSEPRSRLFMLTLLIVLSSMCCYTMRRNLDWHDEESLFRSALHINPPKGKT